MYGGCVRACACVYLYVYIYDEGGGGGAVKLCILKLF